MYTKFQKYWAAPSMVLLIAAVLDPSMKADFVRFFYLTVENAEAEAKMRELRQYLKKYYLEYERVVRNNTETLEALVCAKDWLIGFNDAEEGQPMTGQRMFESDEEDDD
ncbi:unnamed protein product [Miscanthus lutarioriparius]|uniref:hAT-like transposase RNase-H fold domain-containing protein n=1 Tax=Miscanthus lutarioriparius TaxID=422564 RepID=A0A811Q7F0_9POAL|nr:unnamed protein product [Miscanthus lutarioriparius]